MGQSLCDGNGKIENQDGVQFEPIPRTQNQQNKITIHKNDHQLKEFEENKAEKISAHLVAENKSEVMKTASEKSSDEPDSDTATPFVGEIDFPSAVTMKIKELGEFVYPIRENLPIGTVIKQRYRLSNGVLYSGEWRGGKVHGKGTYVLQDRSLLEATAVQNEITGVGRYISSNGDYYEGQFKENSAHGQGVYQQGNVLYVGEFAYNVPHGHGTEKGPSFTFIGSFEKGVKKFGRLTWSDKQGEYNYHGNFKQNLFDGLGELKDERRTYRGKFSKGKLLDEMKSTL